MKIEDSFRVDVPVEEAWKVLLDLERIAPCLPGAQLTEVEGDEYRGTVKIKVGPITAQYKGVAQIVEADEANRKVVLKAEGRDTRGQGNASATVTATLVRRRRRHRRQHRHRPQHHRQGRPVRPRRDGRRVEQAARPVRRQPQAGRADRASAAPPEPAPESRRARSGHRGRRTAAPAGRCAKIEPPRGRADRPRWTRPAARWASGSPRSSPALALVPRVIVSAASSIRQAAQAPPHRRRGIRRAAGLTPLGSNPCSIRTRLRPSPLVLGIDPGVSRCGYGVVRRDGAPIPGRGLRRVAHTAAPTSCPTGCAALAAELEALVAEFRPRRSRSSGCCSR